MYGKCSEVSPYFLSLKAVNSILLILSEGSGICLCHLHVCLLGWVLRAKAGLLGAGKAVGLQKGEPKPVVRSIGKAC